jgi:cyclomaltodextrinase
MKYTSLLIFACSMILFSCSEKQTPKEEKYVSQIAGLASPIRLKYDTTIVFLGDYFPELSNIEKVEFEKTILPFNKTNGEVIITTQPSHRVSNLSVTSKGVVHDIPVFASEKEKFHFSYKPSSVDVKEVEMSGSMNGWNRKATALVKQGDVYETDLILNKGLFQYRVWEDGKEMMDANNPNQISNGMGAFNNTFQVGPTTSDAPMITCLLEGAGSIVLQSSDPNVHYVAFFENKLIEASAKDGKTSITIPAVAKTLSRSHIRIYADNGSVRSNDILLPLANGIVITEASQLDRSDLQTSVMYFAMVDRFADGDTTNDRPTIDAAILPKANNLGGDLTGITQKIKDGYFESLGINTIWISPISQNAEGAWGLWDKGIKSKFSAYHGYWPTALKNIDNRFGNDASMKELIAVAHEHHLNVILDYVAHHVHQNHPLIQQKPEWTTPLYLPDGTMNTEKWDEHRLTTWFDTFLPTWKFDNHEVVEALTDTAMYWVENYDLDGFRHDATKHINEDFWRTLTKKIKAYSAKHPERKIYQVGETYGNPELISSYINSGELDAQFDFNLYDAAVDAFAKDETDFKNLERVMKESQLYYGSHHLMGNITGNQDRARFISYADGSVQFSEDAKLAGWTRDIENKGEIGYSKMAILNAFLMTTPGIPCIYYGDEIGMPGGNDPDNRRMMHFNDWNASQLKLHDEVSQLVKLRRENMALTYGDLFILKNDEEAFVFVRTYLGKSVVVVMDKLHHANENWSVEIPVAFRSKFVSALSGVNFEIKNNSIMSKTGANDSAMVYDVFY